jgi:hypothetical protein
MPMSGMRGCCAPAGGVGDAGQALGALRMQRLDQVVWHAGHGEAAERDDRAVGNVAHGVGEAGDLLAWWCHVLPRLAGENDEPTGGTTSQAFAAGGLSHSRGWGSSISSNECGRRAWRGTLAIVILLTNIIFPDMMAHSLSRPPAALHTCHWRAA